jgi:hypothetical protein
MELMVGSFRCRESELARHEKARADFPALSAPSQEENLAYEDHSQNQIKKNRTRKHKTSKR